MKQGKLTLASDAGKLMCFLFFASSIAAVACFLFLRYVYPARSVFGVLSRMPAYHFQYPLQYILLVTATYAVVATLCLLPFPSKTESTRNRRHLFILVATLAIACPAGGILATIHDIGAGFVPPWPRILGDIWKNMAEACRGGPQILAMSIPYNLIGLVAFAVITRRADKMALEMWQRRQDQSSLLPVEQPRLEKL